MTAAQKKLVGALVGLARSCDGSPDGSTFGIMREGLANLHSADEDTLNSLITRAKNDKKRLVPDCFVCMNPCGRTFDMCFDDLEYADSDIREAKYALLDAAVAYAAGDPKPEVLAEALFSVGYDGYTAEEIIKKANFLNIV